MKRTLLVACATLFSMSCANAASIVALTEDATLVMVDTATKQAGKPMKVSGISGKLLGIDVRPSDGMLYGLVQDGTVVTIDPASGKATTKSKLETMLTAGTQASVDFNPVADRLRIIGSDGMSLRANVDDGKVTTDKSLAYAPTDASTGKSPKVVAAAYTNSMKGAKETTLYDIDTSGAYVKQAPPNDGILNTVGMHGATGTVSAFDIGTDAQGANNGWLVAGDSLYMVDVTTGKASNPIKVQSMPSSVRDIAILP